jgi:hypothetical protein
MRKELLLTKSLTLNSAGRYYDPIGCRDVYNYLMCLTPINAYKSLVRSYMSVYWDGKEMSLKVWRNCQEFHDTYHRKGEPRSVSLLVMTPLFNKRILKTRIYELMEDQFGDNYIYEMMKISSEYKNDTITDDMTEYYTNPKIKFYVDDILLFKFASGYRQDEQERVNKMINLHLRGEKIKKLKSRIR